MPFPFIQGGKRRSGFLFAGAMLFLPGFAPDPALSAPRASLPKFDIKSSCAAVADSQSCESAEAEARDALSALWSGLPAKKRTRCRDLAVSANNSYITALSCARTDP